MPNMGIPYMGMPYMERPYMATLSFTKIVYNAQIRKVYNQ